MAEITYNVSTPREFFEACRKLQDQPSGTSSSTNTVIVNVLADLDFNNDDLYFVEGNWFTIYSYLSTNYSKQQLIINGNNHKLTNIYVAPGYTLFNITGNGTSGQNLDGTALTIKDLEIEVVLNDSKFMTVCATGSTNIWYLFDFRNCIFNIKWLQGNDANNIISIKKDNNVIGTHSAFRIICCIWNIHAIMNNSVDTLLDLIPRYAKQNNVSKIESSQFKVNCTSSSSGIRLVSIVMAACPTTVNNCAVFYDETNPSKFGSGEIYAFINYSNQGSISVYNTYFTSFRGFGTYQRPANIISQYNCANENACFINSTHFTKMYPNATEIALTTEQCKSAAALDEIGYLYASENY